MLGFAEGEKSERGVAGSYRWSKRTAVSQKNNPSNLVDFLVIFLYL